MARVSLLFSLAFALALGSLFLSVSSHTPPVPPTKPLCPKTISELQTLPFNEITKILNQKERSAPKTAEIKAMFTLCKGYVAYLESLYKFENPIVDVFGIAKAKYALTTKAILAVQASISSKVDKKTSLKLKKSSAGFTKGFLQIQTAIVKISAKHDYKADAKINLHESRIIVNAMKKFKNSITCFMDVVSDLEKKKMKNLGRHARSLEEELNAGGESAWDRFVNNFTDRFGSYLGGNPGRELTEVQDKNVNGTEESKHDKYFQFFAPFLQGKQHGRELTEAKAGLNAGAQAGGKVSSKFEAFAKYFSFLRGKTHGK